MLAGLAIPPAAVHPAAAAAAAISGMQLDGLEAAGTAEYCFNLCSPAGCSSSSLPGSSASDGEDGRSIGVGRAQSARRLRLNGTTPAAMARQQPRTAAVLCSEVPGMTAAARAAAGATDSWPDAVEVAASGGAAGQGVSECGAEQEVICVLDDDSSS